jgi:hypothetical protein
MTALAAGYVTPNRWATAFAVITGRPSRRSTSFHCKSVTFEVDIDLAKGADKCKCTVCRKQRMWNAGQLKPGDLRLLSGEEVLGDGEPRPRGAAAMPLPGRCGYLPSFARM